MRRTAWGLLAMVGSLTLGTVVAAGSLIAMRGRMDTAQLAAQPLSLTTILVACLDPPAIVLEIAAIVLIVLDSGQVGGAHRRLSRAAAVLYVLSTIIPAGRPVEDVLHMEKEYGWPVVHRKGAPDLVSHEISFYQAVVAFNRLAQAARIVFVNQFGWSRDRCGERMPADMAFTDIRKGSDLEFGQSIYEPFGIAQMEPLGSGALCVVSNVCGCVGFVHRAAPSDQRNIIVADYTRLPPGVAKGDYRAALGIGQAQRDAVEATNAQRVAAEILARLPHTTEAMARTIEEGYHISQDMSWEVVALDYLLPGLKRGLTGSDLQISRPTTYLPRLDEGEEKEAS